MPRFVFQADDWIAAQRDIDERERRGDSSETVGYLRFVADEHLRRYYREEALIGFLTGVPVGIVLLGVLLWWFK